ncbi:unnamed protein product [Rotaria sp. Silwood1]|nr:unnamed protein product [Rotaria sp. Silwood1]CAF3330421.1 unnamed protein product [Rotaria sp. Silwood1]CAF3358849.1 unnamed protein product [Rotaria sp. Silwood1]CAF4500800.1 unnamed protein product [Rotaria sp. Silwood1]CAF4511967.1 unnamed protein product [Rotaria sp. Silwood1]
MLLKRFFERVRIRSSGETNKQTCLCTTAKRDSLYDDLPESLTKTNEQQSIDQHEFIRSDKPRRLSRQANIDESDGEDDISITEKLRRASSNSPANIPMLVVVSFNPDVKGLQKKQIEIQRGFPVNAQFILNEWLFVKTADNEEGFVPYVCCRPMLRRQSIKYSNDIENFYKPYDFQTKKSCQTKSPSINTSILTPSTNKKFSLSSTLGSQSFLFQNPLSCKKRQDVTSSSCGGDSGFSDCESSSHNNNNNNNKNNHSFDISTQRYARLSNIRSLRSSSNTIKKHALLVQDLPIKKSMKNNHNTAVLKSNSSNRMKYQLSISSNSAFTQFVKKSIHQSQLQENNQHQPLHSNIRLFNNQQEVSSTSSSISNLRRPYNSYDEARNFSSPSSKCPSIGGVSSTVSSPYIRRTPFSRRSLPHHIPPVLKKSLKPISSSSPDPFKTTTKKEQQLRHVVLAEPSLPQANTPLKSTIERHFSDLSLNQIENDSLVPSTSSILIQYRPSLSCSSSGTTSSSSSSSSTTDDSATAFIHIQMNNSTCDIMHGDDSIPVVISTTNNNISNTTATKSSSFIHNVSITV